MTANLNKAKFEKTGIAFDNTASVFPITLSDDVSGIKATVDFDDEKGEFTFDINGEPWENHVFLDSSFHLEDTMVQTVTADISLNDEAIQEGGHEW